MEKEKETLDENITEETNNEVKDNELLPCMLAHSSKSLTLIL